MHLNIMVQNRDLIRLRAPALTLSPAAEAYGEGLSDRVRTCLRQAVVSRYGEGRREGYGIIPRSAAPEI
jgi:hypothetical protein